MKADSYVCEANKTLSHILTKLNSLDDLTEVKGLSGSVSENAFVGER